MSSVRQADRPAWITDELLAKVKSYSEFSVETRGLDELLGAPPLGMRWSSIGRYPNGWKFKAAATIIDDVNHRIWRGTGMSLEEARDNALALYNSER